MASRRNANARRQPGISETSGIRAFGHSIKHGAGQAPYLSIKRGNLIMTHYTKKVNPRSTVPTTELPTVDDLLSRTPLPAKYRHLTDRLRKITAVDLLQTVIACIHQGFSDDGIGAALDTVAAYYESDDHRCTTCLAWSKRHDAITGAMVDTDGAFSLVTICARCQKLIADGKATPTMEKNLMAYGYGGK